MGASSTNTFLDASISNSSKENAQAKQAAGGCQPHGNLTPAHADGCAARCFEGVQCGSIFKGAGGRVQQSAALFLNNACFAPSHAEDHGGRCPMAHTDTNVPVCCMTRKVRFFKKHGHIGPQPKSILLTAAASLYKTHSGSARGDTPPLWAEGAKPSRAYLRRKAATISMNCAFVGGCDNGWPAIRSSKRWSGCLQHACTRVRRFLSAVFYFNLPVFKSQKIA